MTDFLKQLQSPSLVSSFGVNPSAAPGKVAVGTWDDRGFPKDQDARRFYLNLYQEKKTSRMRTPEEIFAEPIKLKVLKIIRRRGKGPQVVWL